MKNYPTDASATAQEPALDLPSTSAPTPEPVAVTAGVADEHAGKGGSYRRDGVTGERVLVSRTDLTPTR